MKQLIKLVINKITKHKIHPQTKKNKLFDNKKFDIFCNKNIKQSYPKKIEILISIRQIYKLNKPTIQFYNPKFDTIDNGPQRQRHLEDVLRQGNPRLLRTDW